MKQLNIFMDNDLKEKLIILKKDRTWIKFFEDLTKEQNQEEN
jgi:hypothetical protein